MQSSDNSNSSLKSNASSLSDQERGHLQALVGNQGFQLFLELVRLKLHQPALSRLKSAKEVPDMCRAQGSVESLEAVQSLLHNTLRSSQGGRPV